MDQKEKRQYVIKVHDLNHTTEPKKHGCYRVLKIGKFTLELDTWNGCYYLYDTSGVCDFDTYLDALYAECVKAWRLPSLVKATPEEIMLMLDVLYCKNPEIKDAFDAIRR